MARKKAFMTKAMTRMIRKKVLFPKRECRRGWSELGALTRTG